MHSTAEARRIITERYLTRVVSPELTETLKNALRSLKDLPERNGRRSLAVGRDGPEMKADLSYEITELEKDIYFLEHSEEEFAEFLAEMHEGFAEETAETAGYLESFSTGVFITDRDGTVNNYCGRYRTSIQPAYNALFLSRFARHCTVHAVILSSAPLQNGGLIQVSTAPEGDFILAGSKAREFRDTKGIRHSLPIEEAKLQALERVNRGISGLLNKDEYRTFGLIGSGVQFKFGETAVARQDIYSTISAEKSERFKSEVQQIVRDADPGKELFRIDDTGYDLEIILKQDGKDYDKGMGIEFLDRKVPLGLENRPALICGDTESDLAMLKTAVDLTKEIRAVFVTTDKGLKKRAAGILPSVQFVSTPDVLVAALGKRGKEQGYE